MSVSRNLSRTLHSGLVVGAGLGGQLGATILFGAVGLAVLAITSTTRNSVRATQDFL